MWAGPSARLASWSAWFLDRRARPLVSVTHLPTPQQHYNTGCRLQAEGRWQEALSHYRKAIELAPGFVPAYNNLGNVYFAIGRFREAVECYARGLHVDPSQRDTTYNLGLALKAAGAPEQAADCFRRALALQPDFAPAMLSLGALSHDRADFTTALAWYEKAAEADPADIDVLYNLGTLYLDADRPADAVACLARALARNGELLGDGGRDEAGRFRLHPSLALVHFNLGRALRRANRTADWLAHYHGYHLPRPNAQNLQYGLEVAVHEGDHDEAEALLGKLILALPEIDDPTQVAHLLSLAQYQEVGQEDLYRCYCRFNELARNAVNGRYLTPSPEEISPRRLRVGYLSPDFRRHVMGYLMYEVISRHDRDHFSLHLYHSGGRTDELTEAFRRSCDSFVSLAGLPPEMAARRIAEDRLDLLVDLAGHTSGGVPLVLAYKPARVQLTHLGYHGALGLDTVAYKLTDHYADLPANAAYLVEGLLPMAGCLMPFRHQDPSPCHPTREELGIADTAIVFAVFVTHRKLSRRCLAAWRAILERVETARLAFSTDNDTERDAILNNLRGAGIPTARVDFIPYDADPAAARARYHLVDIVLDTFPYSGGDTTLAAVDMAVPVVTLCGERQSERVTYSILKNLGVDSGITYSTEEYIARACALAEDATARRDYAAHIREKLPTSVLSDMHGYTRHLEAAFLQALATQEPTPPPSARA